MNHRYPGPEEHQAPRLIVIGCVAGLEVETVPAYVFAKSVAEHFCGNGGQPQSYSDAHGCISETLYVIFRVCVFVFIPLSTLSLSIY